MEKSLNDTEPKFISIEENYKFIEEKINKAAIKSGRDRKDIKFLAATKTVETKYINYAISKGLKYIGENKVQELLAKYDEYDLKKCELQLIGHLQSNKVRQIVDKVALIQSVDSIKLATEIGKQSLLKNICSNILIEVNIGREKSKSGVMPEELEELLFQISNIKGLYVKGLMAIPPICDKKTKIRQYFSNMNKLFIDIKAKKLDNVTMDTLSMGMSEDYYEAITEGATMVRIGSALFGSRVYI